MMGLNLYEADLANRLFKHGQIKKHRPLYFHESKNGVLSTAARYMMFSELRMEKIDAASHTFVPAFSSIRYKNMLQ